MTEPSRPPVVCLCGSTRFVDTFDDVSFRLSLEGTIVLSIATTRRPEADLFANRTPAERDDVIERLAALHRAKIDLADEILVINVGGYIGAATRAEIEHARRTGKPVRYLEPPA